MRNRAGYVYILSSKSRRLYVGVTNDLERRLYEHKQKLVPGFTKRYNMDRLVYFEHADDILNAIAREKQILRLRLRMTLKTVLNHRPEARHD